MSRTSRTLVADLSGRSGEVVEVCGWVQSLRLHKHIQFVVLGDHTGQVQMVHRRDGSLDDVIEGLTTQSAVIARGVVIPDERVRLGGLEVRLDDIRCVGPAVSPLPVDAHSSPDRLLAHPHLAWRRPERRRVIEVQTGLLERIREFCISAGLVELHSPKLTPSASESGADVFRVDYFGRHAYLAQSPQLYKQLAIAAGFDGVFEVGPVFRAEPSHTSRHAAEFTGVDVELAWIDSVEDVMRFEEEMLVAAVGADSPFPRITMADARQRLQASGLWSPPDPDDGTLDPAGERALGRLIGHDFVFVTEFPAQARPFYHLRPRPGVSASFDLLYRGLEITTGAQREHRFEVLMSQLRDAGIDADPMRSYLEAFRHGCPPHGGFGLGLERLTMALLGLSSVREASFIFRGPNRLEP